MKTLAKTFKAASFIFASIILSTSISKAQLNPLSGLYFQNEYLGNPAMAGTGQGLKLNLGFCQQWSSMPGAPKTQSLTADYGTGKKVGLGLSIYTDEAGLIKRSRVMATYAYHLPLNDENQKLRFGLSLGFMDDRVMSEQINGEQNDRSVSKFNQKETYVDGDFGAAYTNEKLTIQAAIPNMKNFLKKEDAAIPANSSTFFSAISYKFAFPKALNGFGVEPKVAFRGIHGFQNILDIGANLTVANRAANVMVIYHSTQSATVGLGAVVKSLGSFSANYTTSTAALKSYTSGNFELSIQLNLFNKKKSE